MNATITKEATAWKLPDLDTVYHCEELGPHDPGPDARRRGPGPGALRPDHVRGPAVGLGAWDTLEEMNAAMATRVYVADPDGTVGFRLVK